MTAMRIVPESTWTRPRDDCPHPERWNSTDAYSTELEVSELVGAFVRALQPDYVIETGTCIGLTAAEIGEALRRNGQGRLISLEISESLVDVARMACSGLPVEIRQQSSMDFEPEESIGFAWFDSLVTLRVAEFRRYRPWMESGTIVGFHDTSPHHGPWAQEIEGLDGIRPIRLRTPRGVTFAEVI